MRADRFVDVFKDPAKSGIDKRSSFTVRTDRWDKMDYERVRKEVDALPAAADALAEITPTARPEMADVFALLLKAAPDFKDRKEIRDDFSIDLAVNQQAVELSEFAELRRFTRGDIVGSAMAAVKLEPELEQLFDRNHLRQKQAEQLQKLREELMEKLKELAQKGVSDEDGEEGEDGEGATGEEGQEGQGSGSGEGEGDGHGQGQGQPSGGGGDLSKQIKDLRAAIDALEEMLKDGLEEDSLSTRASLQKGLRSAADEARTNYQNAMSWGIAPGSYVRLPADQRIKMAKRLNNARLRKIADLFGVYKNIAFSAKARVVPGLPHEITGVGMGRDLEHLLPTELVKLRDKRQKRQFLVDFAEGRLLQYKLRGREKVGKGGIILCEDGSGSMSGDRELRAKAVMLVLLNIAKMDRREFHLIHFGSPGETRHFSFTKPSDFTMDRVIEAAECFFGSGTDFATPLDQAIKILKEEHGRTGRVESDIVFLTDGECGVTPNWLGKFRSELEAIQGTCWGIAIEPYGPTTTLNDICDGLVCEVSDLSENGREFRTIFNGINRKGKTVKGAK